MSTADDSGFLARWSRRKADVQRGLMPAEPAPTTPPAPALAADGVAAASASAGLQAPASTRADTAPRAASVPASTPGGGSADAPVAPTMADVAALTPDASFARFVGRDVDPEVRNAAMHKLFADPLFNHMDGLDVYIDDYGKPDPLPAGMLRQLAQSRFLGLFDDVEADPATPATPNPLTSDEDPDLRLQSNHAAEHQGGGPGGAGADQDPAGQR